MIFRAEALNRRPDAAVFHFSVRQLTPLGFNCLANTALSALRRRWLWLGDLGAEHHQAMETFISAASRVASATVRFTLATRCTMENSALDELFILEVQVDHQVA